MADGPLVGGPLAGISVVEVSRGIAGPMTGMLLGRAGASVTRVTAPGPDPYAHPTGDRVWNRGKRRADLDQLADLASSADVVVENLSPGAADRLGVDWDALAAANPRLVHCSITGYGRGNRHADRPGIDALVAARTGLHWEQRGWPGGNLHRLSEAGTAPPHADVPVPEGSVDGASRDGPLFPYSAWPSLGAAFLATLGVSTALLVRESTGRGQRVETSLLQGVLLSTVMAWQRVADPDAPGLWAWPFDQRAPKGFFRCADGRWIQNWVQRPGFILGAAGGDRLAVPEGFVASRHDPDRLGTGPEDLLTLQSLQPMMVEACGRFPSSEWVAAAAEAGVTLQAVRSPEEALRDPDLLADGCVAEVDDPELGRVRELGRPYRVVEAPAPVLEDSATTVVAHSSRTDAPALAGVTVLDLGMAVAGPFGTQMLTDLGADVIKVNSLTDHYWAANHIAYSCGRGKRSIALDLKRPEGMAVLHRLVARADVVHHNMRYDAAERLGIDDASLRSVRPDLVYCHVRGFERGGWREHLPGNDQMGAAVTGLEWEDGGCADGGRPLWSLTSMGDTGAGLLSAIGVVQALHERRRTGRGQFVDTSIVAACLVNASYAFVVGEGADGADGARPRLDRDQLGLGPLYRLYRAGDDGWLCLAVVTDSHWDALCRALGTDGPGSDPRFSSAAGRRDHADALAELLERLFAKRPAGEWFEALDGAGVPCEISSPTFALDVFDDAELRANGWTVSYPHPTVGRVDQFGTLVDLSDTPGRIAGPPLVVGERSREILGELGYEPAEIDGLVASGVVGVA
jgi:crotonobetainyl-CoA:carnitine CoA-transferase CaiB-like acyl-CoA transferase